MSTVVSRAEKDQRARDAATQAVTAALCAAIGTVGLPAEGTVYRHMIVSDADLIVDTLIELQHTRTLPWVRQIGTDSHFAVFVTALGPVERVWDDNGDVAVYCYWPAQSYTEAGLRAAAEAGARVLVEIYRREPRFRS